MRVLVVYSTTLCVCKCWLFTVLHSACVGCCIVVSLVRVLQDGRLSLPEVLDRADVLRLSTITDYGGMTLEEHDEL